MLSVTSKGHQGSSSSRRTRPPFDHAGRRTAGYAVDAAGDCVVQSLHGDTPGELAHLTQYAGRTHLAPSPAITRSGIPDRRNGPRTRDAARGNSPDAATDGSKPDEP